METPLLTEDGFPRADLDIAQSKPFIELRWPFANFHW